VREFLIAAMVAAPITSIVFFCLHVARELGRT
jgi:hypothetical protein